MTRSLHLLHQLSPLCVCGVCVRVCGVWCVCVCVCVWVGGWGGHRPCACEVCGVGVGTDLVQLLDALHALGVLARVVVFQYLKREIY